MRRYLYKLDDHIDRLVLILPLVLITIPVMGIAPYLMVSYAKANGFSDLLSFSILGWLFSAVMIDRIGRHLHRISKSFALMLMMTVGLCVTHLLHVPLSIFLPVPAAFLILLGVQTIIRSGLVLD